MKWRKKPVVIDAIQLTWGNWNAICDFVSPDYFGGGFNPDGDNNRIGLKIKTLEGTMFAEQGDWIIRGVNGEFYSCKPDIFEKTYEAATPIKEDGEDDRLWHVLIMDIEMMQSMGKTRVEAIAELKVKGYRIDMNKK